jgi:hypothetical protein
VQLIGPFDDLDGQYHVLYQAFKVTEVSSDAQEWREKACKTILYAKPLFTADSGFRMASLRTNNMQRPSRVNLAIAMAMSAPAAAEQGPNERRIDNTRAAAGDGPTHCYRIPNR